MLVAHAKTEQTVRLRKNIAGALGAGHPWVYRDALEPFEAATGRTIRVEDKNGRFVARGLAEAGPIAVRVFTTRDEPLGTALFERRFRAAFDLRKQVLPPETTVFRLCHGEGDRMPGVAIDEYGADEGRFAVMRLDGEAAPAIETELVQALVPLLGGYDGLLVRVGRRGEAPRCVWGTPPPDRVHVKERGMTLVADLWKGQKTGLFLDHRDSRALVRELSDRRRVLNLYAYTGGFSVAAGLGGAAHVTTVDVAPGAIELSNATWSANGLENGRHSAHASDVRSFLESERGMFDLVISDPPSFAPNERSVEAATKAYQQLHASCLRRLLPGGIFLAASCSSHIRGADFEATVAKGAAKAGRVLQLLHRGCAPADHPRLLAFPEGDYLDVVVCRTLG